MKRSTEEARATLEEVCRAAGVSSATVSRVVNGSPLVGGATKRRVLRAIEKLGYRPSHAAQALRSRRTGAIAVLAAVPPPEDLAGRLVAIDDVVSARGFHLALSFYRTATKADEILQRLALSRRADAVILLSPSEAVNKTAARQGPASPACRQGAGWRLALPFVVVGRTVPVSRLKVNTQALLDKMDA